MIDCTMPHHWERVAHFCIRIRMLRWEQILLSHLLLEDVWTTARYAAAVAYVAALVACLPLKNYVFDL